MDCMYLAVMEQPTLGREETRRRQGEIIAEFQFAITKVLGDEFRLG